MPGDTIFALSSGRPPAAISLIRVSGPGAHRAGEALAGDLPQARQAAVRELRHPATRELLDEALVLRFDGPASSTGEDVVELHCHGGRAVVEAVVTALGGLDGLRLAQPGEFTRRAFANGRIDLTEAEGLADLIEAETESQRRAALAMAEGGLARQVSGWRERLLALSADAELAIDHVDETVPPADNSLCSDCDALSLELGLWLSQPRAEPLREGLSVVIAGPPNVGKSSLLNALVGHDRAIVTDIPGTTRDHIDVPLALAGVPLRLTDTAGIRESGELVERIGVHGARRLVEKADILLWLGEPGDAPAHERLVKVHARADLPKRSTTPAGSLAVSSLTGAGLAELQARIIGEAKSILPAEGALALSRRQADCLEEARKALAEAAAENDPVLAAESLRGARFAFERLTGRAGVEDLLDTLFGRFCLGK